MAEKKRLAAFNIETFSLLAVIDLIFFFYVNAMSESSNTTLKRDKTSMPVSLIFIKFNFATE